jgi:DNA-binding FrmR family transcriptional regulator
LSDAQLATSYYRLALAHHDLNLVQGQVDGLKSALAKDKDKLQTYQQILEEMKTVRKP